MGGSSTGARARGANATIIIGRTTKQSDEAKKTIRTEVFKIVFFLGRKSCSVVFRAQTE